MAKKLDKFIKKDVYEKEIVDGVLTYKVSYDKYYDFYDELIGVSNDVPINISLYDDRNITYFVEAQSLINKLNGHNIENIDLYLSDYALNVYIVYMLRQGWKHQKNTNFHLSLDRKPLEACTPRVADAPGMVDLPEEKLLYYPEYILDNLKKKTPKKVVTNTRELKKVVKKFYNLMDKTYHLDDFSDIEKTIITYDYVKNNVSYSKRDVRSFNDDNPRLAIVNGKGNELAQSRLMVCLLNNPYMNVEATVLNGKHKDHDAYWTGIVNEDKLYHVVMKKNIGFCNPNKVKYYIDKNNMYFNAYKSVAMLDETYAERAVAIQRKRK